MVGLSRLELPTSRLSGVRSNLLSYKPMKTKRVTLKSAYDHGCFVIFWRIPSSTALSLSVTAVGRALNPLRCLLGLHPNSPKT